ncbi:MAG: hypothetical protein OJF51_004605 [Nitrospira sp.]|nr:MAG: hypothetical protein OJF51_004605 [Nitrospira sp.]
MDSPPQQVVVRSLDRIQSRLFVASLNSYIGCTYVSALWISGIRKIDPYIILMKQSQEF